MIRNDKNKRVSLLLSRCGLVAILGGAACHAAIVFQDTFAGDGLAVNTGIGGGLTNYTGASHSWSDDGNLNYNLASNANFRRRAAVVSDNSWQSSDGFQVDVTYQIGSSGGINANQLSWGLVSSDVDFSTYFTGGTTATSTGYNPFGATVTSNGNTVYSFGFSSILNSGLYFTDGASASLLDAPGTNVSLPTVYPTGAVDVSFSILDDGSGGADWSYSIDGTEEASGNITVFDFSKSYQFVGYGQDNEFGDRELLEVTVSTVPEPASILFLGVASMGMLLRRSRKI